MANKRVRAIHANRGIEAKYRRQLAAAIDELHKSVTYWLTAAYRKNPPALAMDATPSQRIKKPLADLAERWIAKFDEWGPKVADAYVTNMFKASDSAFRAALKDAGWAVDFKLTPGMRDALEASIAENVGLIKSIPEKYLQQVEGVIMRSYGNGRDLETMVADLKALYPGAANRAALIARDQSNKANAVVNRARQSELGITDGEWMHSHAGKVPRPSHVAANGKKFKIAEGCLIDGEYILPGEKINCRCTWRAILPF